MPLKSLDANAIELAKTFSILFLFVPLILVKIIVASLNMRMNSNFLFKTAQRICRNVQQLTYRFT